MNEAPQLEVVDLGDAKEETKGRKEGPLPEEDVNFPRRNIGD